jgi:predicted DNA-binding protein (MmcQ/YjbR family)
MAWIGVLNPSPATFETLKPLIDEGYRLAVKKFEKRAKKSVST